MASASGCDVSENNWRVTDLLVIMYWNDLDSGYFLPGLDPVNVAIEVVMDVRSIVNDPTTVRARFGRYKL